MEKQTIIISFSSRKGGNCEQICDYIQTLIQNCKNYSLSRVHIEPCGKCNYECFNDNRACPHIHDSVYDMLDSICNSKNCIFIIPNYCDYPCANFFVFNERSLCYFQGHPERLQKYMEIQKQVIVISNSDPANIITAMNQHASQEVESLKLRPKEHGARSTDCNLISNELVKQRIADFVK